MIRVLQGSLKRTTSTEGQRISFLTKDIREADKFFADNMNKPLLVDFKSEKAERKRSLTANSYLWVLAEKIAKTIRSTREEVYRDAIREVGVFHDGAFLTDDLPDIKKAWESNGIGWFTEDFDSKLEGCRRIRFYHGSSLYNQAEMSRLIDYIVEQAKHLEIDVRSPDEIERMKQQWGVE